MLEHIKINIKNIEKKQYQTFNIKYSKKEEELINKIKKSKKFTFKGSYGLTLNGLYAWDSKINNFLSESLYNTESEIKELTKIIKKIIKEFMNKTGKDSALIHIRASQPNDWHDIPRWHQDGRYWGEKGVAMAKFVTVFKGPPTLVHPYKKKYMLKYIEDNEYIYFNMVKKNKPELEIRKETLRRRKKLSNIMNKREKSNFNSAYTFVNNEYATLHSEPAIDSERLFMAVLPGYKTDLAKLRANRRRTGKTCP